MSSTPDSATVLNRIAELATRVATDPVLPASVQAALAEIVRLATPAGGDTPEPSDLPNTENQSL